MHIKTRREEWVTHMGVRVGGGEGQLFPLAEHRSSPQHSQISGAHEVLSLPQLPYISHSPLDTSSEGNGPQTRNGI